MATANSLIVFHNHSSLPINLLPEHTGFTLNYFLSRYLLSRELFSQNFKYLILVKKLNFFFYTSRHLDDGLLARAAPSKRYVFTTQGVKRLASCTFEKRKVGSFISNLRNLTHTFNFWRDKAKQQPLDTFVNKQSITKKTFNTHPFFNALGSNLRSNKWYFIGIIPLRFTQASPDKTYFKYLTYKRKAIHPRFKIRRTFFKRRSFKKMFFKKLIKSSNKTFYDLFIPHQTEDDIPNQSTFKIKYKIKLRAVPNTKLARKAPYKHSIDSIWKKPFLFVNKKKRRWKFKIRSYSKYFLMGNFRKFFKRKFKYLNKTKRFLNGFKSIIKSGAVLKIKTKKIRAPVLTKRPKHYKHYKDYKRIPKLTISKSATCKRLFLLTRILWRRKIRKYFKWGSRHPFLKRFKKKTKTKKLRTVSVHFTFEGTHIKGISLLTNSFLKINFINFNSLNPLRMVPRNSVECEKTVITSYNKFIKTNHILLKHQTKRVGIKPVKKKKRSKRRAKRVKVSPSRAVITKTTQYLTNPFLKRKTNVFLNPKRFTRRGILNFVYLNKLKFIYSKRQLTHHQLVLNSAKRFSLLNFYYRVKQLRKDRIRKLVKLLKKFATLRLNETKPSSVLRKLSKVKSVKSLKTKKKKVRRVLNKRVVTLVKRFLKKRKTSLSKIRNKLRSKNSQLRTKNTLVTIKKSNKLGKGSVLPKIKKKKWRILKKKYKKKVSLLRFSFRIRRMRRSRRFRRSRRMRRMKSLKRFKRSKRFKHLKYLKRTNRLKRLRTLKRFKRLNRFKRRRSRKSSNKVIQDSIKSATISKPKLLKRLSFSPDSTKKHSKTLFLKISSMLTLISTRLPFITSLTTIKLPYNLSRTFSTLKLNNTRSRVSTRNKDSRLTYAVYSFTRYYIPRFIKKIYKFTNFSTPRRIQLIVSQVYTNIRVNITGAKKTSVLGRFLNWYNRISWYASRLLASTRQYDYVRLNFINPVKNLSDSSYLSRSINTWLAISTLTGSIFSKLRPKHTRASSIFWMRKNRPSFSAKTRSSFMLGVYGFYLIYTANALRGADYMRRYLRKLYIGLFSFPDSRSLKKKLLRRFTRFKKSRASVFSLRAMSRTPNFSLFSIYNSLKNNLVDHNQNLVGNTYLARTLTKTFFKDKAARWRRLRRIRFKPGYSKIWRKARTSFKSIWALKFKYQHRLTSYLARIHSHTRNSTVRYSSSSTTLFTTLVRGRFVADTFWSGELINSNSVYLNSLLVTNPKLALIKGDLLQLLVHIKHYIILKWQKNLIIIKKARLQKFAKIKSRPKTSRQGADRNYTYPDWIMNLKFMKSDVPAYYEVDYFTLSLFVIYNPLLFQHNYSYEEELYTPKVLRLYNWKYIN